MSEIQKVHKNGNYFEMTGIQKRKSSKVLITDYAWENLEPERKILERVGATLVVATTGTEKELIRLVADVDVILTCWKPVSEQVIRGAPKCRAIGRYGIGLDNIDVAYATQMGILVTNVPAYCLEEVSDHAMALLLSCARKTCLYDRAIKAGLYDLQAGTRLFRISGKTLGIVGFGRIGKTLYRKAIGFGVKIIAYDPYLEAAMLTDYEVELVSFEALLERSDYVSIHAPLSPENRHLFNFDAFRKMKDTAFVINTSRGEIIDQGGLLKALDEMEIAGAGLDVLAEEPPSVEDPLIRHPKTIITPHAAFCSQESLLELQETAATQMAELLSGKLPCFVVNPEVLEQPNLRACLKNP